MSDDLKASEIRLAYTDGSTVVAYVRPVHMILCERKYGADIKSHLSEATLYCAWLSLGSPDGSFDAWLGTLESFEEGRSPQPQDPTNAAASADAQQS